MPIGILYESIEWSSFALEENIKKLGVETIMLNTEEDIDEAKLLSCELIVSRVFASAQFRGHQKSLEKMPQIIEILKKNNIPMINPYEAHYYEISKELSTNTLRDQNISVPEVYGVFRKDTVDTLTFQYPCIIKPNCGGRTNATYIINNKEELEKALIEIPNIEMIAEEFIEPIFGYLTRIEVIDHECKLILKRSVAENGLSAYHLGSKYEQYRDCREEIKNTAIKAMELLQIESGSMDIIENKEGFFIIDVNSVSNASEDNTEMFEFDLMLETAKYIVKKYNQMEV